MKTPAYSFRVDEKHFEHGVFRNDDVTTIMWLPWPSFHQAQIQNDWWLLHFYVISVEGNHKLRFQTETFVFKLLRRSVDGEPEH